MTHFVMYFEVNESFSFFPAKNASPSSSSRPFQLRSSSSFLSRIHIYLPRDDFRPVSPKQQHQSICTHTTHWASSGRIRREVFDSSLITVDLGKRVEYDWFLHHSNYESAAAAEIITVICVKNVIDLIFLTLALSFFVVRVSECVLIAICDGSVHFSELPLINIWYDQICISFLPIGK